MNTVHSTALINCGQTKQTCKWKNATVPMKVILLMLIVLGLVHMEARAQGVGISESTITPDASAVLEVRSSSRGLLFPRNTSLTPTVQGLTFFNTSTNRINFANGSSWFEIPAKSDNLSVFASTTSAQLAGVLSDETGTGLAVFGTAPTFASTITIGTVGGTTGAANFLGTTSGTITVQPQAAAGSYNFNLPTAAGLSGQPLLSGGGGATPMSFGTLGAAAGGTGQVSYAIGDILYASASTTLSQLADVAAGSYLRSGGVTMAPVWSTLTLPNSATTGDLFYASGSNVMGNLVDIAAGRVLISGGVGVAPSYSATPTLGVAGSTLGTLSMSGNTSGTVTVQPQAAAGTYNFNLPTTAGTSSQVLQSGGGAAAPMTWAYLGGVASITANATATAATTVLTGATWTMPANLATAGDVIRLRCNYRFVKTVSPPTLTCNLTVAGASVASFVITSVSSATTSGGYIEGYITIITSGAAGTLMSSLHGSNNHGITNATNWNPQSVNIATSAINTTGTVVFALTMNMTTAVAANTLTISQGWIEVVKP